MEGEGENELNEEYVPEEGAEEDIVIEAEDREKEDQEYEEEGVEEEDVVLEEDIFGDVPRMKLPKDPFVTKAYEVYMPSIQTENLKSEKNRTIFAEAFQIDQKEQLRKVPRLTDLCFDIVLKSFTGGNLNSRIQGELRVQFGEQLDPNFALKDILDLDIDSYWKKVFLTKSKNKVLVCQKTNSPHEDWKSLGIQEKLRELIETSRFEKWNDLEMVELAKKLVSYIKELEIMQLIPLEEYSIEKDPNLVDYKIYHYPCEDCHHISLEFLGELSNMTSLHIEFQPAMLGYKYEDRMFSFSYLDMENLAKGLVRLESLREFKICRSRMDNKKLQIISKAIVALPYLELLDFSYCQFKDDSGWTFATILAQTKSIRSLKLDGNALRSLGICSLCYGIQNYEGHLEYVSLAENIVGHNGVVFIGRAINNSSQIDHLNLNGILVAEYGAELAADLIKGNATMTNLEICSLPLGEQGGNRLIRNLNTNRSILKLECRGCNMTDKQEYQIKILLMRNNYLHKVPFNSSVRAASPEERKELDKDIDNWTSSIKHPVLLNVLKSLEEQKECKASISKINFFPCNIPKFIPKAACKQKTNKELLLGEYYDTTVEDMRATMHTRRSVVDKFVYDPNNFNREEFIKHCDFNSRAAKNNTQYFTSSSSTIRKERLLKEREQLEKPIEKEKRRTMIQGPQDY